MPYEVLKDGATIPKALGELKDNSGNVLGYQHQAKVYRKGEILADEDVSPVVVEALENDDPWTSALLAKVSADPNVKGPGGAADVDFSKAHMGPETGSPGVIMPDAAAAVAEAQNAAGEGDQPLAAGVSAEGQAALDEAGFVPSSAGATYDPAASPQTPEEAAESPESGASAGGSDGESESAAESSLPRTHAELDALAAENGVTFSGDSLSVAQKQAELRAAGL